MFGRMDGANRRGRPYREWLDDITKWGRIWGIASLQEQSHGQKELEEFGEAESTVLDDEMMSDDLDEMMMMMMMMISFEPLNFTFNFDYRCWNNFHFHCNIISIC